MKRRDARNEQIRRDAADGVPLAVLADRHGVTVARIWQIVNRWTRKHARVLPKKEPPLVLGPQPAPHARPDLSRRLIVAGDIVATRTFNPTDEDGWRLREFTGKEYVPVLLCEAVADALAYRLTGEGK